MEPARSDEPTIRAWAALRDETASCEPIAGRWSRCMRLHYRFYTIHTHTQEGQPFPTGQEYTLREYYEMAHRVVRSKCVVAWRVAHCGGQHSQPSEADFHSLPTTVYAILPTTMCSNGLASRSRWRALSCQVRGVASIPNRCGVTNPSRATVVQRSHLTQRQQARRPTHRLQVAPSCYMPSSQSTGASSRQHRTLFRCIDATARGCCTVP